MDFIKPLAGFQWYIQLLWRHLSVIKYHQFLENYRISTKNVWILFISDNLLNSVCLLKIFNYFFTLFQWKYFKFLSNLDKNKTSFRYLAQVNYKSEWLWKIYIEFIMGGFFATSAASSIVSIILCYVKNGHFEVQHVYRQFRFRFVKKIGYSKLTFH